MHRILIVDDDPIILCIYRRKLQCAGFNVTVATDGEQAGELLNNESFDILLLDLALPKISGLEILKMLGTKGLLANLPVIAFTNSYLPDIINQVKEAGAKECLSKTENSPESVIDTILKHLPQNPS